MAKSELFTLATVELSEPATIFGIHGKRFSSTMDGIVLVYDNTSGSVLITSDRQPNVYFRIMPGGHVLSFKRVAE